MFGNNIFNNRDIFGISPVLEQRQREAESLRDVLINNSKLEAQGIIAKNERENKAKETLGSALAAIGAFIVSGGNPAVAASAAKVGSSVASGKPEGLVSGLADYATSAYNQQKLDAQNEMFGLKQTAQYDKNITSAETNLLSKGFTPTTEDNPNAIKLDLPIAGGQTKRMFFTPPTSKDTMAEKINNEVLNLQSKGAKIATPEDIKNNPSKIITIGSGDKAVNVVAPPEKPKKETPQKNYKEFSATNVTSLYKNYFNNGESFGNPVKAKQLTLDYIRSMNPSSVWLQPNKLNSALNSQTNKSQKKDSLGIL